MIFGGTSCEIRSNHPAEAAAGAPAVLGNPLFSGGRPDRQPAPGRPRPLRPGLYRGGGPRRRGNRRPGRHGSRRNAVFGFRRRPALSGGGHSHPHRLRRLPGNRPVGTAPVHAFRVRRALLRGRGDLRHPVPGAHGAPGALHSRRRADRGLRPLFPVSAAARGGPSRPGGPFVSGGRAAGGPQRSHHSGGLSGTGPAVPAAGLHRLRKGPRGGNRRRAVRRTDRGPVRRKRRRSLRRRLWPGRAFDRQPSRRRAGRGGAGLLRLLPGRPSAGPDASGGADAAGILHRNGPVSPPAGAALRRKTGMAAPKPPPLPEAG